MRRPIKILALFVLAMATGCESSSSRQSADAVSGENSVIGRVADYGSSDPNQEPTLRLGRQFEIRTTNGGPVVLQSQVEQQKKAVELQRARTDGGTGPAIDSGGGK